MSAYAVMLAKKIADNARKEFALRLLEKITDESSVQIIKEELARFNSSFKGDK